MKYLLPSWEYTQKHKDCNHPWGKCDVKVPCNCQRFGLRSGVHYDNCELATCKQPGERPNCECDLPAGHTGKHAGNWLTRRLHWS
jgi:hypothetical protein